MLAVSAGSMRTGTPGITFATYGINLTVDSEATYNGAFVPSATWSLKDLIPGVDKFFNFDDIKPGDQGENTISLHLDTNGWLCLDFLNLTENENGVNEPESHEDVDGIIEGELAEGMEFFGWVDDGDNIFELGERPLFGTSTQAAIEVLNETTYSIADAVNGSPCLQGDTCYFGVYWCAGDLEVNLLTAEISCDPTTIGNEAQTDSMSVDVSLRAYPSEQYPALLCDGTQLEGCTPGYWKQSQHFGNWQPPYNPFSPGTPFSSVFEDAFPGKTLLQVLGLNGSGLNALGRHAVAALLNSVSPDVEYAYTTADIIAMFNGVYPGGDYETLKDKFVLNNEFFCPLGVNPGTSSSSNQNKKR